MLLAGAGACSKSESARGPELDEDDVKAHGLGLPLVEGRSVEVDTWKTVSQGSPAVNVTNMVTTRVSVLERDDDLTPNSTFGTFFGDLQSACTSAETTLNLGTLSLSADTLEACAEAVTPRTLGIPLIVPYGASAVVAPIAANCMAHTAMHIAEETEPLYITSNYDTSGSANLNYILKHGKELPEPYTTFLASNPPANHIMAQFARRYDPEKVKFAHRVRPPNASDRASWALIAAEYYRIAAMASNAMLTTSACANGLDASFTDLSGNEVTARELLAGNLADAVNSAIEAAEKAQKHIAAAASEKRAGAADPTQALIAGWRGRHDSRLEAVSAFVDVPEALYQEVQPIPLYIVTDAPYAFWTSHTSDFPDSMLANASILGWILPPDAPHEGLIPLRTYMTTNGQKFVSSAEVVSAGATPWRLEGWLFPDDSQPDTWQIGTYVPPGVTASGERTGWLSLTPTPRKLTADAPPYYDPRLPVVTAIAKTGGDVRAEELLRETGVNPCFERAGKWCGYAYQPDRTLDNISEDLLTWLSYKAPASYAGFEGDVDTFLASEFITKEDVSRAALRIIQSSEALGRPITLRLPMLDRADTVADEEELPLLVNGTAVSTTPIHPAFLYAQTAGQLNFSEGPQPFFPSFFARRSLATMVSLLDIYARLMIGDTSETSGELPRWKKILREFRGTAEQYTEHAGITAEVDRNAIGQITKVKLIRNGIQNMTQAELNARCGVWLDERGLDCGLRAEGSAECQRFRFGHGTNQPAWTTTGPGPYEDRYLIGNLEILATQAPLRPIDSPTSLGSELRRGDRIYVLCEKNGVQEPIAAITLDSPPTEGTHAQMLPPFSKAVLEALTRGLAPDPEHPEQTELSCAGVPYTVKIPLENELSEASEGADSIESSFVHYLRLAREAATRADTLGAELVQQGLEMDLRAEEAREELEDLCGGVVNVPSFSSNACHGSQTCNVPELLAQENVDTGNDVVNSELSGAAQCLGVGSSGKPTWAGLGSRELCIWQYYDASGAALLPMVCPPGGSLDCSDLPKKVMVAPAAPATCASVLRPDGELDELDEYERGSPNTAYARRITKLLNMSVAESTAPADTGGNKKLFGCRPSLALRLDSFFPYERPSWANQADMRSIADSIGYEEDPFGIPLLTKGGRPWINFGNASSGPRATLETGWPYRPHPMLEDDPNIPGPGESEDDEFDEVAAQHCTSPAVTDQRSLLCGGYNSSQLRTLAPRLQAAVLALKGLTGASFSNVRIRKRLAFNQDYPQVEADMEEASTVPAWFTYATPGTTYYRSLDNSSIAYEGDGHAWIARSVEYKPGVLDGTRGSWDKLFATGIDTSVQPPVEGAPGFNTSLIRTNGLVSNSWGPAQVLWTEKLPQGMATGDGEFLGLGDMLGYVTGKHYGVINSQVRFEQNNRCPEIPSDVSVCYYSSLMAWAPGKCNKNPFLGPIGTFEYTGNEIRGGVNPPFTEKAILDEFGGGEPYHAMLDLLLPYACNEQEDLVVGTHVPGRVTDDAMDLACAAVESGGASCPTLLAQAPQIDGVEDFPKLSAKVQCAAESVQQTIDNLYIAEMPPDVVRDLAQAGAVQTFPQHRGLYGQTVAELATQLITLRGQGDMVVQAVRDVGTILNKARAAADALELNIDIQNVEAYIVDRQLDLDKNALLKQNIQTRQAISNAVTSCVVAMTSAASDWTRFLTGTNGGDLVAATATCANSALQTASEMQLQALNEADFDIKSDITDHVLVQIELGEKVSQAELNALMYQTALDISSQFDKIHQAMLGVQTAQAGVQGLLAKLEMQRNQARRAAAKVLMLGSDETGRIYNVNSAMRSRMNTLRVRYEKARDNAIRLSYMARRAVEQKLGVDLSFMTSDMTLVEAPAKWADKLCSLSGIDYDKIRTGGQSGGAMGAQEGAPEDYDYADGFVGDWVTLLENFVESYSVDMPFQAGTDVAVVSLRDEICNVSETATVRGWNELYHSDGKDLSSFDGKRGWQFTCGRDANNNLVQARIDQDGSSGPFECVESAVGCRALGMAGGLALEGVAVTACDEVPPVTNPNPSVVLEPPAANREYWFRGDSCTAATQSTPFVCTNRGIESPPQNRTLRLSSTTGVVELIPNGLGGDATHPGLPTIRLQGGSALVTQAHPQLTDRYTVSVVYRPELNSHGAQFLNAGHANGTTYFASNAGSGQLQANWSSSSSANQANLSTTGTNVYGIVARPHNLPMGAAEIYTYVVDGPNGVRLYVNGKMVSASTIPATPQQLGSIILYALGTGPSLMAEHLTYSSALSGAALDQLHAYLADRYRIDLKGPTRWIDAADIRASRLAPGNVSTASGYPGSATAIYDWKNGQPFSVAGSSNMTPTLQLFGASGNHYGMEFDGSSTSFLYLGNDGLVCDRVAGAATCTQLPYGHDELSATMVMRVNAGTGTTPIWGAQLSPSPVFVALRANQANRSLYIEWTDISGVVTTYTTPNEVYVAGQPFVVTLQGSRTANRTTIYVNGVARREIQGRYMVTRGSTQLGAGGAGPYLRGNVAEYQSTVERKTTAEIADLHGSLMTKYGIPVTGGGAPPSGIAVAGPARMRQVAYLAKGNYWLSWYEPVERAQSTPLYLEYPDGTVETRQLARDDANNTMFAVGGVGSSPSLADAVIEPSMAEGWVRYYTPITLEASGNLGVGFVVARQVSGALGAIQLERMEADASDLPRGFFPTTDRLTAEVGHVEDSDGSTFRTRWHRGCEYYCPPGSDKDCAANGDARGLPQRCFYETDFGISLEEIEKGTLIPQAGFARGNFNYRFDDVALNLVGTGIKDCSTSKQPSACYAGSFLQYSIRQTGPYRVRNYEGNSVRTSLYPGQIQQAKALLAERYFTNPISSADRNLVTDYWRSEFRGRPIDGAFKIRIYDADGLNWEQLKDVQMVMRYRYWTRLE